MTDRSLKIYQGEDLSPVTDLTDMAIWEDAEFGTRAWRGEAINSNVTIRDPDAVTGNPASLPGGLTPISLSAGNVLEYVHGSNVRWRGRMASKDYSRGDQRANRYREAACYLEDVNIDLRGIVVHGWARPAETDVARVQAAIAHYGRGGAAGRPSTVINGSNLVSGSNLVTLAAKTYTKTDLQGVFEEIATEANKTFFLRSRRFTSDTHTAEMVYDGTDALIERCPFKITDRPSEVAADPFAFFPIWNVGPAATENGQELISGVWLFYGSGDNDYVHVSDAVQASEYIKREVVVYDDTITTAAQATRKANAILAFRAYEERTINVTIGPLNDAQLGSIRVGQTIAIKARAITFADDLYYDGKISQLKETSPTPGTFFVHLQLDRPWRMGAHGRGAPVGPKPPSSGTTGTENTDQWQGSNVNGGSVATLHDGTTASGGAQLAPWTVDPYWSVDYGSATPMGRIRIYHTEFSDLTPLSIELRASDVGDGGSWSDEVVVATILGPSPDAWADEDFSPHTARYFRLVNTGGSPPGSDVLDGWALREIETYDSADTAPTEPGPVVGTGDGSQGSDTGHYANDVHSHEHANITTGGPYHMAEDVTVADSGTYYTGTDAEAALQEVGADLADHETRIDTLESAGPGMTNPMTTAGDTIYGGASGTPTRRAGGTDGQVSVYRTSGAAPAWETQYASIECVFDGGGSAIAAGTQGDVRVPFACEIVRASLLADQTGSIVIDVWVDTYANYPPTVADTITASAKPTLSGAIKSSDITLTGWTKTLAEGSTIRVNVDSAATVERVTLELKVRKT